MSRTLEDLRDHPIACTLTSAELAAGWDGTGPEGTQDFLSTLSSALS